MTRRLLSGGMVLMVASSVAAGAGNKSEEAKPEWQGAIPVQGKHRPSELRKMAKITRAAAKTTALKAVEGKSRTKKAREVELEVENGYLVYSVDVKVARKDGVEEIPVDAGTGKVLAHEHESSQSEAREKKQEKKEKR